jgi:copper transport protein
MSSLSVGRGMYRCMQIVVLLLVILTVFVPGRADRAIAQSLHAALLRSDPVDGSVLARTPGEIRLWFSEPVQLVGQSIMVFAPSGAPVELGTAQERNGEVSVPLKVASAGTYLVNWQIISQDTDPVSGSFVFSVGHAGGAWAGTVSNNASPLGFWLQALAHLLHFLGYTLAFGVLAFLRLVVAPLKQDVLAKLIWRLVNCGIVVLLVAEGVALIAQAASLGNHSLLDLTFLVTVLASSFGRALALRLGAALSLWVFVGIIQQGSRRVVDVALVLGGALALIDSQASHAITSPIVWLGLIVTALHIVAMGAWIGGLIALLALWRRKEARAYRQDLFARFGPLAIASVVELVLTGVVLAGLHLAGLSDLLTTPYGRLLTIKIVALLLPLLFALLGQRRSHERWWLLEGSSLLGILTLAALLVSLPPPR